MLWTLNSGNALKVKCWLCPIACGFSFFFLIYFLGLAFVTWCHTRGPTATKHKSEAAHGLGDRLSCCLLFWLVIKFIDSNLLLQETPRLPSLIFSGMLPLTLERILCIQLCEDIGFLFKFIYSFKLIR